GFAAWIPRHAEGVAEPETLVDLRIDPYFGAAPRPETCIQCHVDRFPPVRARAEAVRSLIRGAESRLQQPDIRPLPMNGPGLRFDLLGLFRGDRNALRLRCWTNHLSIAHDWPTQNADRSSGDGDDTARKRGANGHQ